MRLVATDAVDNNTSEGVAAARLYQFTGDAQRAAPELAARLQGGRRAPSCQRRGVAPLHRAGRRQCRDFFARRERGGHAARLRCDCRDGVAPRDADRVDAPGEQGAVFVAS